jgi:hypothetical protein
MGGFQVFERPAEPLRLVNVQKGSLAYDVGRFVRILEFHDVFQHTLGTIIPVTTEEEIKDKGKSDGISKFIVLLQTSWFIIQCIARGLEHLPLTELEIVTLAYSMMNLFIYIFWWDKPRDVGCPIRVYENLTTYHVRLNMWHTGVGGILQKVSVYALGAQDQYVRFSRERKVPMFWSGGVKDSKSGSLLSVRATLGPSILGIAFGAIHYIAWSYEFPSHTELVLWRTSCIAMMAVPLLSSIACAVYSPDNSTIALNIIFFACVIPLAVFSWFYIAARIATIVMAFTTLRSLPSEAFTVIDWTTFIPHISLM